MYPLIRLVWTAIKARRATPLRLFDTHVSRHLCHPWDIDPWMEMNNGRILTLYDQGRVGLMIRLGLTKIAKENGWGIVVAGASVRYRKRILAFQRYEMRTRVLGWDARFIYLDQSMWRGETCCSQALIRGALTQGKGGMIPPARVATALGSPDDSPSLPDWVSAWVEAEATRPWPPHAR